MLEKSPLESNPGAITSQRKEEHLEICTEQDVSSEKKSGWEQISIPHCALPEISFDEVKLEKSFLGHHYKTPLLISSMTGGSPEGERINLLLARAAEKFQCPMGVGSQRALLERRDDSFSKLKKEAPRAHFYANIGAVQLNYGVQTDDCKFLIDILEAKALILHANVLQESIQEEGDKNFSKLFPRIEKIAAQIPVPVILKETGCGLDLATAKRALNAGVSALDVAGMGGTHWGFIEGLRKKQRKELGTLFRNWGIPSAEAFEKLRSELPSQTPLIASGGIRNALDAAKAYYLGADFVGMALPFLKAAQQGYSQLVQFIETQREALQIALFCSASKTTKELSEKYELKSH